MGFLDFLAKPGDPSKQEFEGFDIFLDERNVQKQKWDYNYRDAYEYFRETGIDPYDQKSKKWVSKFKHPLSEERFIKDKKSGKWFDTINSKFVDEEKVAQQVIERLEYTKDMPLDEER